MNLLQPLSHPLHNSTHRTHDNKIAFYYTYYQYQNLNYSAPDFFWSEHYLAKCPASLQQKQMTSNMSQGFFMIM